MAWRPDQILMAAHVMKNLLKTFFLAESGSAAAEYALLIALVGTGIALAAGGLGTAISTALTTSANAM